VLALLAGGCTILIDADEKQCTKDTQCTAPYVCGSQGICSVKTGCETSEDCRQPGICIDGMCKPPECETSDGDCDSNKLCNTESGRCVEAVTATCKTPEDCAPFEGAQVCRSEGRCGTAECGTNADCTGDSTTVTCEAGACVDDTWGCLGVDDPRRAQNSSETATLKFQVLSAPGEQVRVQNLDVKVCAPLDPECRMPFNVKWTYDQDRYVVIEGLEAGRLFRIQLRGENPDNQPLLPGEYVMYRPAYGVTEDPLPVLMFLSQFRDLAASGAGAQIDPSLGFLLMRVFDCSDREVEGVSVTSDKPVAGCGGGAANCRTAPFYPTAGWTPDVNAVATSAGRAGIVNLPTDVTSNITLTRVADGKKVTSFLVTPLGGWVTYIHFWPWKYL
jgi:hypothetical protein